MVKNTGGNVLPSSFKNKASFVQTGNEKRKIFKLQLPIGLKNRFISYFNFVKNSCLGFVSSVNWNLIVKDSVVWFCEAIIEGFIINFSLFILLDFKMTFWSVIAYGFVVKEILDLIYRVRHNGSTSAIRDEKK